MSFERGQATVVEDNQRVRMIASAFRKTGREIVLVPLGEGLHAGHIALVRAARRVRGAVVIVALHAVDEQELSYLKAEGVDVVWRYSLPTPRFRVVPEGPCLEPTAELGAQLTKVLQLICAVMPSVVVMGEKDYELLVTVNATLKDLNMSVKVQGVPTVRMPDGVALSLRNVDIEPQLRGQAQAVSAALTAGAHAAENGAQAVLEVARSVLEAAGVEPDYLELRGANMQQAPEQGDARLLLAATVGGVRLIDNAGVPLGIGFRNLEEYQAAPHASRVAQED